MHSERRRRARRVHAGAGTSKQNVDLKNPSFLANQKSVFSPVFSAQNQQFHASWWGSSGQ
jgi:hypothetical protein